MARLEYIRFNPSREVIFNGEVTWEVDKLARSFRRLPQIFWSNGEGWAAGRCCSRYRDDVEQRNKRGRNRGGPPPARRKICSSRPMARLLPSTPEGAGFGGHFCAMRMAVENGEDSDQDHTQRQRRLPRAGYEQP